MITLQVDTELEQKINKIAENYGQNHNVLITDVINYYTKELTKGIKNIERNLRSFETKYQMKSEEFYKQYITNEIEDSNDDLLQWCGEYEIWLEHQRDLKIFVA